MLNLLSIGNPNIRIAFHTINYLPHNQLPVKVLGYRYFSFATEINFLRTSFTAIRGR